MGTRSFRGAETREAFSTASTASVSKQDGRTGSYFEGMPTGYNPPPAYRSEDYDMVGKVDQSDGYALDQAYALGQANLPIM